MADDVHKKHAVPVKTAVCGLGGEVLLEPMLAITVADIMKAAAEQRSAVQVLQLFYKEAKLESGTVLSELQSASSDGCCQLNITGVWEEDWAGYALEMGFRFYREWCDITCPDAFPILAFRAGPTGSGVVGINNAGFNIDWMDNLADWSSGSTRWHTEGKQVPSWEGVTWPPDHAWATAAELFAALSNEEIESRLAQGDHGNPALKVEMCRMVNGFREVELVN